MLPSEDPDRQRRNRRLLRPTPVIRPGTGGPKTFRGGSNAGDEVCGFREEPQVNRRAAVPDRERTARALFDEDQCRTESNPGRSQSSAGGLRVDVWFRYIYRQNR